MIELYDYPVGAGQVRVVEVADVVAERGLGGLGDERGGDETVSGVHAGEVFSGSFVGRKNPLYVIPVHGSALVLHER